MQLKLKSMLIIVIENRLGLVKNEVYENDFKINLR